MTDRQPIARFLLNATPKRYEHSTKALASLPTCAFEGYREMLSIDGLSSFVRERECLYLYSNADSFKSAQPSLAL